MKKTTCIAACLLAAGCSHLRRQNEIVKETYIHKYGVPVDSSEWKQTKEGKIVQLRKDGVTVEQTYSQGMLDGDTTYSFPNSSTVHITECYSKGRLQKRREHAISGTPARETCIEDDGSIRCVQWYEDGTPLSVEVYRNRLLVDGEYRSRENSLESRVKDGYGIRWVRNMQGDLMAKETIQKGQMIEQVAYDSNGDPIAIATFENGRMHGKRHTFLQGGIPERIEQWSNGEQDGITILFVNGDRFAEIPYVLGKKHGVEKRFRDGTVLAEEVTWKEDIQHGERKIYVDGKPRTEWFHQGELVSRTTFERLNPPR